MIDLSNSLITLAYIALAFDFRLHEENFRIPLLVLWVLAANYVYIFALLPPHALAPIA
jgi:hypothetical protein